MRIEDTYMCSQDTSPFATPMCETETYLSCTKALPGMYSYTISITARPTIFPSLRSWNALPDSSKVYFLVTAWPRSKIPVSANLINFGRSCLALPPYEPITFICSNTNLICLDEKSFC